MHHALTLYEVAHQIASSLNRSSYVLNFALTCRAFLDPALDALWYDLPSFIPLVNLLPPDAVEGSGTNWSPYTLKRSLVAEDMAKFNIFAKRVRVVNWAEDRDVGSSGKSNRVSPSVFEGLSFPPGGLVLGGLRQLDWHHSSKQGSDAIQFFLSKTLRSITLQQSNDQPEAMERLAGANLAHLKELKLLGNVGFRDSDAFHALFHDQSPLKKVSVTVHRNSNPPFMSLQRLPHLGDLQLDCASSKTPAFVSDHRGLDFKNLEALEIKYDLEAGAAWLAQVHADRLVSLSLQLAGSLGTNKPFLLPPQAWSKLRKFRLQHPSNVVVLQMSDIDALINNCPGMRVFITNAYIPGMEDEDIARLATAWPDIRSLIFEAKPDDLALESHRPHVTLAGLEELARRCNRLKFLTLCIDATQPTQGGDDAMDIVEEKTEGVQVDPVITEISPNSTAVESENPPISKPKRPFYLALGSALASNGPKVGDRLARLEKELDIRLYLAYPMKRSPWDGHPYSMELRLSYSVIAYNTNFRLHAAS